MEDCEKALRLNEGNYKALYRKARSLKELGRHQEAYEAVAKCSLAVPQVSCPNLPESLNEFHFNFVWRSRWSGAAAGLFPAVWIEGGWVRDQLVDQRAVSEQAPPALRGPRPPSQSTAVFS